MLLMQAEDTAFLIEQLLESLKDPELGDVDKACLAALTVSVLVRVQPVPSFTLAGH